ncbi:hypothetical protein SAMN05428984_2191 [Sphingomonas sp. OK281]|nr:hypothetical protein SAMN05428984_2191 [Sphingomonas sp. OK281]
MTTPGTSLAGVKSTSLAPPWKGGVGGGSGSGSWNGCDKSWPTHPQPLPSREGGEKIQYRPQVNFDDSA